MVDDPNIYFDPHKEYNHLLECLVFFIHYTWVLCCHKGPSKLLTSDIIFTRNDHGKGYVEIKNLHWRNNGSLSLRNTHF